MLLHEVLPEQLLYTEKLTTVCVADCIIMIPLQYSIHKWSAVSESFGCFPLLRTQEMVWQSLNRSKILFGDIRL